MTTQWIHGIKNFFDPDEDSTQTYIEILMKKDTDLFDHFAERQQLFVLWRILLQEEQEGNTKETLHLFYHSPVSWYDITTYVDQFKKVL